jgi:alanyl-tRNA synthetase
MQQFKSKFKDPYYKGVTICNIQSCLRFNDFSLFGDGTHLGYFNMIGTFSFRHWSVQQTVDFWMKFITEILQLKIDYTTIHPDKPEWSKFYDVLVKNDDGCKWTDGEIGGYCTEFYVNNVEVGNIVNPLGNCIDVGFGLERLDSMVNGTKPKTTDEVISETIMKIIDSGYLPTHYKQGYVLKRLLRTLYKRGGNLDHPLFHKEVKRQQRMRENYRQLLPKNPNMSKEWWYSTHGIDLDEI